MPEGSTEGLIGDPEDPERNRGHRRTRTSTAGARHRLAGECLVWPAHEFERAGELDWPATPGSPEGASARRGFTPTLSTDGGG